MSGTYRSYLLGAMRTVLDYGVRCDYLDSNPATKVTRPKQDTTA